MKRARNWARSLGKRIAKLELSRDQLLEEAEQLIEDCKMAHLADMPQSIVDPVARWAVRIELSHRADWIRYRDASDACPVAAWVTGIHMMDWLEEQRQAS